MAPGEPGRVVSAERMSMVGALTPAEIWVVAVKFTEEISGETIICTRPSAVMKGVTFKITPTSR